MIRAYPSLLLAVIVLCTGCAGVIADRVVRAPNYAIAPQLPVRTSAPAAFGGADDLAAQGVAVRRVAVAGGAVSLRIAVVEPGEAPFVATRSTPGLLRRAWPAMMRSPLGTVVLLHGLWGSLENTAPHAAALANAGFRCVLVDMRGHGESTGAQLSYGRHEADDVLDLLRSLRRDGTLSGPVALVGFSFGASVAVIAASQGAPVATVVAVAPFARLRDVAPFFADQFAGWLTWLVTDGFTDRVVSEAGRRGRFDPLADSPLAAASRLQVPILFIHGNDDELVPQQQSELLAAAVTCAHRRELVPGQTHIPVVLQPALSMPLMLPWLVEHLAPQRVIGLDGPLAGWVGEARDTFHACWAWRAAPVDLTATWPRPVGGRQVRTWFRVPPAWLGRDLLLDLGTVESEDETWLGLTDGTRLRLGGLRETEPLPLPLHRRYVVSAWSLLGAERHSVTITVRSTEVDRGIAWAGGGTALLRPLDPP